MSDALSFSSSFFQSEASSTVLYAMKATNRGSRPERRELQ